MASVELASVESKNVEVEIGQEESKAESKVVDVPLSAEANNKWAKALEGKSKALPKEAGPYDCCVKPTCNSFGCVYRCCCCFGFDTNTYMRRGLCAVFYIILIFILAMVACAFMAGYASTQFFLLRRPICQQNNPLLPKSDGTNTLDDWHVMNTKGDEAHVAYTVAPEYPGEVIEPQTFPSHRYDVDKKYFEEVSFQTSDNVRINATWMGNYKCAPTVIVVHGNSVCRNKFEALLPMYFLNKTGYNALAIDMRNHGHSQHTKEKRSRQRVVTWGAYEHRDVEAAINWLKAERGYTMDRIGLFGVSMGGAVVQFTALKNKELKAVWADTPVCNVQDVFRFAVPQTFPILNMTMGWLPEWATAIYLNAMMDPENRQLAKDHLAVAQNVSKFAKDQQVQYVSMTGDLTISPKIVGQCYDNAMMSGAGIRGNVNWWQLDDRKDFNTAIATGNYGTEGIEQDTHIQAMLYYTKEYEAKLIAFYKKGLGEVQDSKCISAAKQYPTHCVGGRACVEGPN